MRSWWNPGTAFSRLARHDGSTLSAAAIDFADHECFRLKLPSFAMFDR
jgi:hypothetical protein